MCNQDIRNEINAAGLKLWVIAENLGMADSTLSRKLRHELTDNEKAKIRKIICDKTRGEKA